MEQREPIIRLEHLVKEFKTSGGTVRALEDINLDIYAGEIFGIIGLSGAGKSTLVRCINYLETPTSGEVIFEGVALSTLDRRGINRARQSMGMIFQQFNLLAQRNVLRNVCFPMELQKTPKEQAVARARELLQMVGLADREDAYPAQLSGGQKQRVAIAGVVAMHPKCIVMDEPTAMLDPNGRKDVIRTVRALNRREGITVLLITHYMEEVVHADRVIVMDDGKIVMDGTPREIFSQVDRLKAYRLDVPQVTELAYELRKAGMDLPEGILTRKELMDNLLPLLGCGSQERKDENHVDQS